MTKLNLNLRYQASLSPLFPQLVDSVEDVDLRGGIGVTVNVVNYLVHTDECPSPTHSGTGEKV